MGLDGSSKVEPLSLDETADRIAGDHLQQAHVLGLHMDDSFRRFEDIRKSYAQLGELLSRARVANPPSAEVWSRVYGAFERAWVSLQTYLRFPEENEEVLLVSLIAVSRAMAVGSCEHTGEGWEDVISLLNGLLPKDGRLHAPSAL